jgi:hypothetical protein
MAVDDENVAGILNKPCGLNGKYDPQNAADDYQAAEALNPQRALPISINLRCQSEYPDRAACRPRGRMYRGAHFVSVASSIMSHAREYSNHRLREHRSSRG